MSKPFKRLLLIIILALCGVLVVRLYEAVRDQLDFGRVINSSETFSVTTKYGDNFFIVIDKCDEFVNVNYQSKLYHGKRADENTLILSADYPLCNHRGDLLPLYSSPTANCYGIRNQEIIIWHEKPNNMYGYAYPADFQNIDPKHYGFIVRYAKSMVRDSDWSGFYYFADFLIRAHDKQIAEKVHRYAQGTFTQRELQENTYSVISREKIILKARKLEKQFHL